MPDSPGPLPPLAVNGALLAMPLLPLLTAAAFALLSTARRPPRVGRIWTVGPTLASTAMLSFLGAYVGLGASPDTTTVAHGVTFARAGWLDVGFDVACDRLTGAFAFVGGTCFAALLSWLSRAGGPRPLASLALGNAAAGFYFIAVTADAAPAFVAGAGASAAALAWLAARAAARPRAAGEVAHRAFGDVLLALGLAALATSFRPGEGADGAPLRAVAVSRPDPSARPKSPSRAPGGTVTMVALPGAAVRTEGSPTLSALVSPFVRSSAAVGSYRGHVKLGPGAPDLPFAGLRVTDGAETRLSIAGPTVAFRAMEEQGTLPGAAGSPALARAGVALVAAGALLRAAYAGSGRRRARGGGLAWLSAAPPALLGAYLLARLSFAWQPPSGSLVGLGLLAALAASGLALGARRPSDAAEALVALYLGLAVASAGVGAPGAVFAFGIAPALVVATLVARSSPRGPDPDPDAGGLTPAWALPHALLGAFGVSSFAGRLPLPAPAGLLVLAALAPAVAAAALLTARAIGAKVAGGAGEAAAGNDGGAREAAAGSDGVGAVVANEGGARGGGAAWVRGPEGVVLAALVTPLGVLGAEPWFELARAKAPVLGWASASAAWGPTRPLVA
ncbi:MAG TPA: hypothetical protein VFS00_26780, partial [Polyangiaceae bacterium]|nr:hypothetical protein [Polyangiaceae bacterium]